MEDERRALRVLHLASFAGNSGDLANHAGARSMFQRQLHVRLDFTELEIREFYWKLRSFDAEFVRWANGFDLLLIGGGNYFELWVEKSMTGTSIDIAPEHLAALTVPTVFYALGVDTGQGYTEESAQKFRGFMATVLARENMFVCVRNDGSARAMREVLGDEMAARIPTMPDGGFFVGDAFVQHTVADSPSNIIGINIAGDMLERRFNSGDAVETFLAELAGCCTALLDAYPEKRIELIPHIWRDSLLFARLLPLIPDRYLRRQVRIASLDPTVHGLPEFVRAYRNYDLVLGMRFHANVCPIGLHVPTRALLTYPQVQMLYEELNLGDRLIDVSRPGFGGALAQACLLDLADASGIRARYISHMDTIRSTAEAVLAQLDAWLRRTMVGQ